MVNVEFPFSHGSVCYLKPKKPLNRQVLLKVTLEQQCLAPQARCGSLAVRAVLPVSLRRTDMGTSSTLLCVV